MDGALPTSEMDSTQFLGGVRLASACWNEARSSGDRRHDADFASRGSVHAAHFKNSELTHVRSGVEDALTAVEADLVGLMFQGEWTCQMLVAATKDCFVQKVEDCIEDLHELALSFPPRNRAADRNRATTTGALSGGTAVHV